MVYEWVQLEEERASNWMLEVRGRPMACAFESDYVFYANTVES